MGTPANFSGGLHERRIVWKAGCLETCTSGLELAAMLEDPAIAARINSVIRLPDAKPKEEAVATSPAEG